jgi:hypothetical protein
MCCASEGNDGRGGILEFNAILQKRTFLDVA